MDTQTKVKLARNEFPVAGKGTYLNTASLGTISKTYAQVLKACIQIDLENGRAVLQRYERAAAAATRVCAELARLVNAKPEQLLLTNSTGDGLRAVIESFSWHPGDEIITTNAEHSACLDPLNSAAKRNGLRILFARLPEEPEQSLEWLTNQFTNRTKLIAISAVDYKTGRRLPVEEIASIARKRNVKTLIDAAQCLGGAPLNLGDSSIDFCAMPLQKWLCGPQGLGVLYNASSKHALLRDRVPYDWCTLEATAAHLEWLSNNLDWAWILQRTSDLANYAHSQIQNLPNWNTPNSSVESGIVTLQANTEICALGATALTESGFTFRYIPEHRYVRISTAFFNSEDDIDNLLTVLAGAG